MDDKGEIVSGFDVDDNVALQIWTKGRSPRLVIFNKGKNSRKLIRLGWVEKKDRKLAVNGPKRGQSVTYSVEGFMPAIQRILSEYAVYTNFRIKLWKFAADFEKVLHVPEIVTDKGELNLLSEEKRSCLWIADCTGANKKEGAFRPFFPVSAQEAAALPENMLRIFSAERDVGALMKTGATRALAKANPARWLNPVRVTSAAMLLGFSCCEADSSDLTDLLWGEDEPEADVPQKDAAQKDAPKTIPPLRDLRFMGLGHKLVAFLRHFDAADKIEPRVSMDSDKEMQDAGFSRKRRFDFSTGTVGDVPYKVTFFENEDEGMTALGCKPESATLRHKGELVYSMPTELYKAALRHDTMGGPEDDFYTMTQLMWARQFKDWYESVIPYVESFAGLM